MFVAAYLFQFFDFIAHAFVITFQEFAYRNHDVDFISACMKSHCRFCHRETGRKIGFKPAGGINTVKDALTYYTIVKEVLGKEWLNNQLFRLGTSRLANLLLSDILGQETKFF